ncbi:hypothetical protein [Flavobacterium weaverense]|uniref:Uncharacterized protein n=1 Tax=Flavobacterium weaverense TaxID=271156 RepID=A0A3L9ZWC3_9FLAO|nr:hypothetical protein [Flavobacterium weaverense]RMA77003.1 hypothetical protein BC961_0984 [Flavobacterium weaverense]
MILIPFFIHSCASPSLYLKDYEPISMFLETQKIDKNKKHILQVDKAPNKRALRIFNGEEVGEHILDPTDPIDYTDGQFVEKHWKKMYKKYDFMVRYIGTGLEDAILISEPMYYMNKKYIMFYCSKAYSTGGGKSSSVIMKKKKENWTIVRVIRDNVY